MLCALANLLPEWDTVLLLLIAACHVECNWLPAAVTLAVSLPACARSSARPVEAATVRMPYTSPLLLLPAPPDAGAMVPDRPHLPHSYSAQAYIRRHRRSPSFSKLAPASESTADSPALSVPRLVVDPHTSLRQSPPPRNNAVIPAGAIISPPESAGNSSDEETSPRTVRRPLPVERLDAAIRSLQSERAPKGEQHHQPDKEIDPVAPLTPEARAIAHSRSSTENDIQFLAESLDSSSIDSDRDELAPKPPMVRKKSGEVVRPALRTKRRPSSMPGTPTFSKNVHFDSQLEHIRHFLQLDRPLAVSADTSPVEAYSEASEYPFHKVPTYEWEVKLPNFPADSTARRAQPVRLDRIYLSPDQQSLIGVVVVANLAFQKNVLARFTLDYWKTVSEVSAEYNHDVRRKHVNDGFDRFNFTINLSDVTNLETKTLSLCIRYTVAGQEYWDNNSSMNYQIGFAKKEKTRPAETQNAPIHETQSLPRSRSAGSIASSRPLSMPTSFGEFGSSSTSNFSFPGVSRNADSDFGLSPLDHQDFLEQPKPREKPAKQAWSNRYDFGASLSAVKSNGASEDRTTLTAKARSADGGHGRSFSSNDAGSPKPQPAPLVSGKLHHESSSYKELVDKYCFYGTATKSMEPPHPGPKETPPDGRSLPAEDDLLRVDSGISITSDRTAPSGPSAAAAAAASSSSSSSSAPSSATDSYNNSPTVCGKGGKGLGKGGAKRHRKILRDNIQGITKPAIRRLARRGGVKRISAMIYEETRGVLKSFLESVIRDAVTYTEHAKRKTVTSLDVVYALKRQGRTLYGFGG
ncbi:Histone H4,2 [Talaromyces islandicus]|uniref:Histone H4 n=1 Tax=Talaromyces islandicus TaxID=28573 RepID=A0A0U1M0J4_TALIS|nr:Histone H4,2 [Talaromyces islandicus]